MEPETIEEKRLVQHVTCKSRELEYNNIYIGLEVVKFILNHNYLHDILVFLARPSNKFSCCGLSLCKLSFWSL